MSQWQKANPHATLTEMEEAVEAELAKLRKQLVEEMVREKEAASQEVPDCPQCGEQMVKNGRRQRELKGKEGANDPTRQAAMALSLVWGNAFSPWIGHWGCCWERTRHRCRKRLRG